MRGQELPDVGGGDRIEVAVRDQTSGRLADGVLGELDGSPVPSWSACSTKTGAGLIPTTRPPRGRRPHRGRRRRRSSKAWPRARPGGCAMDRTASRPVEHRGRSDRSRFPWPAARTTAASDRGVRLGRRARCQSFCVGGGKAVAIVPYRNARGSPRTPRGSLHEVRRVHLGHLLGEGSREAELGEAGHPPPVHRVLQRADLPDPSRIRPGVTSPAANTTSAPRCVGSCRWRRRGRRLGCRTASNSSVTRSGSALR